MRCEMCGREGELKEAVVEGAMLSVCFNCSKFGVVVKTKDVVVEKPRFVKEEVVDFVVDEYSHLIRKGRERKGLKQEELAKYIGERESVVSGAEAGRLKPGLKVAKKLEVFLGIKLISKDIPEGGVKGDLNFKDSNLTIGDLLKG